MFHKLQTIDSIEMKYTEIASPLIALGIIATSLFFVKVFTIKED